MTLTTQQLAATKELVKFDWGNGDLPTNQQEEAYETALFWAVSLVKCGGVFPALDALANAGRVITQLEVEKLLRETPVRNFADVVNQVLGGKWEKSSQPVCERLNWRKPNEFRLEQRAKTYRNRIKRRNSAFFGSSDFVASATPEGKFTAAWDATEIEF